MPQNPQQPDCSSKRSPRFAGMLRSLPGLVTFCALLSFGSCAQSKFDGTWQGQGTGPTGQHFPLIFTFHGMDTTLRGTLVSPMGGDTIQIQNGSIHGDSIAFDIVLGNLHIHHEGTMAGDSIQVKTSDPQGGGMSLTLRRKSSTQ